MRGWVRRRCSRCSCRRATRRTSGPLQVFIQCTLSLNWWWKLQIWTVLEVWIGKFGIFEYERSLKIKAEFHWVALCISLIDCCVYSVWKQFQCIQFLQFRWMLKITWRGILCAWVVRRRRCRDDDVGSGVCGVGGGDAAHDDGLRRRQLRRRGGRHLWLGDLAVN